MTEINTDEIRAGLQGDDHPSTEAEIRALCDALDAAHAERDEWKANTLANEALYLKHFNRAKAAEARIGELNSMYDVAIRELSSATARIAAALSAGTYVEMVEALTEGIAP